MELVRRIAEWFGSVKLPAWVNDQAAAYYTFAARYVLAVLAVWIVVRAAVSLLSDQSEKEIWGYLALPNGAKTELDHWENVIGRGAAADVLLEYPTISRSHAALIRDADGKWTVYDLNSKGGVEVNGERIAAPTAVEDGTLITLGGVETVFMDMTLSEERAQAASRTRPGREIRPGATLLLLTLFQLILAVQLTLAGGESFETLVPLAFLGLIALEWLCYVMTRVLGRSGFEPETLAFFLTSVGFATTASASAGSLLKELICLAMGIAVFWVLGSFLRDLRRAKSVRWPMAMIGLALLLLNVLTAKSIFGARNWISIGSISFQPSEFVKICFIFAGAATLDRLFARRNILLFVVFSGACVLCLAMMSDFGTAAVFFAAYIVIAFMRSGSYAAVFLSGAGAVFAGFMAITLKPYIAARFATWGHAWEYAASSGYQQTRTMASAASGGLFGLGGGKGWLKHVFAADTDMVFGMVCEELGLVVAVLTVAALLVFAFFAVRAARTARSSYYVIASCTAVTIFLVQMILNVFGSVDMLPFTGVTFPFVSNGGSSLITCWGMLAFIKAADTRQNASFAIRLPRRLTRRERKAAETL